MAVGNLSLVWDDLKSGIDDIFKLETLKRSRYMELYTHVYNYCTFVEHRGSTQGRMGMDPNPGGGKLVGLELYKKLRDYLRAHVHNVKVKGDKLTGEEMLSYFEKSWSEFRFAATVLNGACAYLNRHWVKRECDEGRKNVYAIYAGALLALRGCCRKNQRGGQCMTRRRGIKEESSALAHVGSSRLRGWGSKDSDDS